jgi:hypothetical protein
VVTVKKKKKKKKKKEGELFFKFYFEFEKEKFFGGRRANGEEKNGRTLWIIQRRRRPTRFQRPRNCWATFLTSFAQ